MQDELVGCGVTDAQLCPLSMYRQISVDQEREALLSSTFAKKFTLQEPVIYSGLASTIYLGSEVGSGLRCGLKVMLKSKMDSEEEKRRACAEIALHSKIPDHPNIVRLLASEETLDAFVLATPYAPQGDLWSLTSFGTTYCEREVRNCAAQMVAALHHIHSVCDTVHGDIKPHNFLLFKVDTRHIVQLCDFGLAVQPENIGGTIKYQGLRGTSGWFAPELIQGLDHGFPADLFGTGLILFRMLAGYAPFDPPTNFQPVEYEESYWCHITQSCKQFLSQLLAIDASARCTTSEARQHAWLNEEPVEPSSAALLELCKYGPPPCSEVHFWPVAEPIPASRLGHYAA